MNVAAAVVPSLFDAAELPPPMGALHAAASCDAAAIVRRLRGDVTCSAVISECTRYRWSLSRTFRAGESTPRLAVVMLNPSTADGSVDDPTVRKLYHFADMAECGGFDVVNLFAWRATDPAQMLAAADPIGPENDHAIYETVRPARVVLLAWGVAEHPVAGRRVAEVLGIIRRARADRAGQGFCHEQRIVCLGRTKDGHPRHPLYVPYSQTFEAFSLPTAAAGDAIR